MTLTELLHGRMVAWVATDETQLVLGMADGHEVRIKWGENGPELAGQDVRIVLPSAGAVGQAGKVGD